MRRMLTRTNVRYGLAALALLATALFAIAQPRAVHGLRATYHAGGNTIERIEGVAFVSSNDSLLDPVQPFGVKWRGYLWAGSADVIRFQVPEGLQSRLAIDGRPLFDTTETSPAEPAWATASLAAGAHAIEFGLSKTEPDEAYFLDGLTWRTAAGARMVPATYLYPDLPDPTVAKAEALRATVRSVALAVLAACVIGLVASLLPARPGWWRSRSTWALAGLVLLALGLRLLFLRDVRANLPNHEVLPMGSDHRGYVANGADFVRGLWPPEQSFYVQPGIAWLLGQLTGATGDGAAALPTLQLAASSLAVVAVFRLGRQMFGEMAGWFAALLWATLPVSIFYDAQPLTHSLEALAVIGILVLWMGVLTRSTAPLPWLSIALLGITVGAAIVLRPSFGAFVPLIVLSVLWRFRARWAAGAALSMVLLVSAALPVSPVTLHNYRYTSRFQLVSSNGPVTLYIGNNRDAAGIGEYSPAFLATHELVNRGDTTYAQQTVADIAANPARWIGLMLRKTALYFGAAELPNNVDFYAEGTQVSPVLAALPIRFGALVVLGLVGLALALLRRRGHAPGVWVLAATVAMLAASTIAFHVVSRFRAPLYGPLAVLGGFTLAHLVQAARGRRTREIVSAGAAIAVAAALLGLLPYAAERSVPGPSRAQLPASARHIDASFGDALELVGYEPPQPVEPGEPLFTHIYLRSSRAVSKDYYGSVQLFGPDGEKVAQADQPLGTGSFPDYPTSQWQPGQIVWDQFLLFPPKDLATPVALSVLAAVYDRDTGERLGETWLSPLPVTYGAPPDVPNAARSIGARIGPVRVLASQLALRAEQLTVTLYWEAVEHAAGDGVVFMHLLDGDGNLVLGQDTRPRSGTYPMTVWQPGEGIVDVHTLQLSSLGPGVYDLYTGVYDPTTGERFPIQDAAGSAVPDNTLAVGQVTIP